MVFSAHLQNISQILLFPQVGVKIQTNWNHHLELFPYRDPNLFLQQDVFLPVSES